MFPLEKSMERIELYPTNSVRLSILMTAYFPRSSRSPELYFHVAKREEGAHSKSRLVLRFHPDQDWVHRAAVSVACAAALSEFLETPLEKNEISDLAFKGESAVHGNPSGLDIQASQSGGLIMFKKNLETKPIHLKDPVKLLVVFSGRKRSTSKLIAKVAEKRTEYPNQFQRLVNSASAASFEMVEALRTHNLSKIGSLFTNLQIQLSWIGVSTEQLDNLIEFLFEREDVLGVSLLELEAEGVLSQR